MKKLVACVLVLALSASAVFAEPLSIAVEMQGTASVAERVADVDSLFADITAPRLADAEADAVEGEGPAGYAVGYAIGMVGTVGVCSLAGGLLFYGAAVAARAMGNSRINPAAAWSTGVATGGTMGAAIGAKYTAPAVGAFCSTLF